MSKHYFHIKVWYTREISKRVMSNYVSIPLNFFCNFSFITIAFIKIHEYVK